MLLLATLAALTLSQSVDTLDLTTVGKDPRWKVEGRTATVVDVKGKHALELSEGPGNGIVWLDGYDFGDGTIDVDILGRSQPVQGSFVGIAFRVVDRQTHDAVYFRPFNFRATDSTRHSHAVEYVSEPTYTWQRLRSEHPGQYEAPVVPEPDGDEWFHARIVVERPKVTVFVNGATTPALVVNELSDRKSGRLGVWVGEGSGGYFANLRVASFARRRS
jgi:Domain of Unknown Function (DUF1080)